MKTPYTRNQKTRRSARLPHSAAVRLFLLMFVLLGAVGYIGVVSKTATTGYLISDLEAQTKELERENQQLEIAVAEYTSMQTIKKRLQRLGMEQSGDVQYLTPVGSAVARR